MRMARMPTGTGLLPLADVPDRERSDGGPERVIRGEHPVIAMPVLRGGGTRSASRSKNSATAGAACPFCDIVTRPLAGPPMVAAVTGFPTRSRRRPHGGPVASRRYERRRPEKTPLHRVVCENLESWLPRREAAERPVPGYVEDQLRGYLECGLLCFGFARARCTGCGQGFVVLLQVPRSLPVVQRPPHGPDGRASCRSRHPAGARAAVGDQRRPTNCP